MYKKLYVLGDSLSDNGAFTGIVKHLSFAKNIEFDPPAYQGRCLSDGKVAVEWLADSLEIDLKSGWKCTIWNRKCEQIGYNYAVSSALAAKYNDTVSRFFFNKFRLKKQVEALISHHKDISRRNDLFFMTIGGNDIIRATFETIDDTERILERAVSKICDAIKTLYQNNARNIVIANVPDVGVIPAFNKSEKLAVFATALTDSFNNKLANSLNNLEAEYIDLKIKRFDLHSEFRNIINKYKSEGKNYTDAASSNFIDKLLSSSNSWYKKAEVVWSIITSGRLTLEPCSEDKLNEHLFFDPY